MIEYLIQKQVLVMNNYDIQEFEIEIFNTKHNDPTVIEKHEGFHV